MGFVKKIIIFFLVLFFSIPFAYSQSTCYHCKKVVTDMVIDGKPCCSACNFKMKSCSKCKQLLKGASYTAEDGSKLCKSCAEEKEICSKCKKVFSDTIYQDAKGNAICENCIDKLDEVCAICSQKITTSTLYRDKRTNAYCPTCFEATPVCMGGCGAPVGKNLPHTDPYFPMCSQCSKHLVNSHNKKQADEIYTQVRQHVLKTTGLSADITPQDILFAEKEKLKQLGEKHGNSDLRKVGGYCHYENGKSTIYIVENTMPSMVFMIIGHEYGHAIHFQYRPGLENIEPIFYEGFAEWIAYKAMISAGHKAIARQRLNSKDPIYGEGLRKMLEYEKLHGVEGVIQLMKTKNNFD